jgi:hypothetical protein
MDIETIIGRVRSEFIEMPGLCLSLPQAQRLWGLEKDECQRVIDALIADAFLRRTRAGQIVRAA